MEKEFKDNFSRFDFGEISTYIDTFILGDNGEILSETKNELWRKYQIGMTDINHIIPSFSLQTRTFLLTGTKENMTEYIDNKYKHNKSYTEQIKTFHKYDIINRDKVKPYKETGLDRDTIRKNMVDFDRCLSLAERYYAEREFNHLDYDIHTLHDTEEELLWREEYVGKSLDKFIKDHNLSKQDIRDMMWAFLCYTHQPEYNYLHKKIILGEI